MASQQSIISYTPQPYYIDSTYCSVENYYDVASFENEDGLLDPDLSNYTVVIPNSGDNEFGIRVKTSVNRAWLSGLPVSCGFIGCAMLTYEDDGGSPDLETEFSEDIVCAIVNDTGTQGTQVISYAHNSQDQIKGPCGTQMPGIISGGRTNVLFSSMGTSGTDAEIWTSASFVRDPANVTARPHARLIIGHFFNGIDIPITIDPRTFQWSMQAQSQRFRARDFGTLSSEGTMIRECTFDTIKLDIYKLMGIQITDIDATEGGIDYVPNLFDLTKVNNSYPILFNPYPYAAVGVNSMTTEIANYYARQNFFSIYGFLDGALNIQSDEYREGLNSEYRARMRIMETR